MEHDSSEEEVIGNMLFDTVVNNWKVDGSIRQFLGLFTRNAEWKKGNLGADKEVALLIIGETMGAWHVLTKAPDEAPMKIHKLDVPLSEEPTETIDYYREFRPLTEDRLNIP